MNYTKESEITLDEIILLKAKWLKGYNIYSFSMQRMPNILYQRLHGRSLKDIANHFGIQRERVRQQEAKAIEIIKDNR